MKYSVVTITCIKAVVQCWASEHRNMWEFPKILKRYVHYVELIYNSYITLHGMQNVKYISIVFVCFWRDSPQWVGAFSLMRFLDNTQRPTAVGRTSLYE